MIRPAVATDAEVLCALEGAAGEAFRGLGMDLVADAGPPPAGELGGRLRRGPAWVAEVGGAVAAYLLGDVVDGCAHVEQVSVHPDHAGHGYGALLVERLAGWARDRGLPALTLTTYRHVPWNGPYYERLGFRWLADDECTSGLRALREAEGAAGLDAWPRGCMRRDLRP